MDFKIQFPKHFLTNFHQDFLILDSYFKSLRDGHQIVVDGAKILLVDDDPVMRELASAKLAEVGYKPIVAENGAEALAKIRTMTIDLVISDIEMPVMDGFQLTRSIRRDRDVSDTPIIVITASDNPDDVDRIFAEGATSFLSKPINWTLFNHAVRFVLRANYAQKDLRAARDQAEAGAKFKDALMSVMSHELRTPLNAIIGFGQLLGAQFEKQNDPLHGEYANYIVEGGKRLLESISDMLLASDARSGPIAINEREAAVGDIVDSAKNQLRNINTAKGVTVKARLQDRDLEIICDRVLLSKALSKLLENAVAFSPEGASVTIGAALTKSGELAMLVKDEGPGIDAAKLQEISAPFAQSNMSLKRSKEGLGLGLPMAKAIAAAHGAQFRLDSKVGEGTRALIVLPADRVAKPKSAGQSAA